MKENDSNKIFNTEFSFDFGSETNEYFTYKENKKQVLKECLQNKKIKENIDEGEEEDDQDDEIIDDEDKGLVDLSQSNDADEDDALGEDDALVEDDEQKSKQDFEEMKKKHDHVRLKAQSTKKRSIEANEYFELPSNEDMNKKSKNFTFEDMNISKPLIKALAHMGLTLPTSIQTAAIPTALMGKDICACAVTGSGKTLAFMLPTIERLLYKPKFPQVTRVLVLTPTRELAVQICKVTRELTQFTNINTVLCAGGFDIKTQEAALRMGPDICIATPGRLIDHLQNTPCFNLEAVEILILDEADRMLDECFFEQLKEVMRLCSKTHQTMLFSATMTDKVEDLVRMSLKKPVKIFINENMDVTPKLKQEFVRLRDTSERNREAILAALIQRKFYERVIVFVRTKSDCHRLCLLLTLFGVKAAELHGGLTQTQRLDKLNAFKENTLNVMVATDLAARGLDITNVKTVINFSMPMTFKHYIHRVGRTARAQNSGRSISLVGEQDRWLVKEIVKSSKEPVKCRLVPPDVIDFYREKVDGFRGELVSKLKEEQDEKQMDKMERDIEHARSRINSSDKSNGSNIIKRTWLPNVDYKNGGLLTNKKSHTKKFGNKNKDENAETNESLKRTKKSKFLSKHHKEQHDNIFSKKFKNNALKNDKRKKNNSK